MVFFLKKQFPAPMDSTIVIFFIDLPSRWHTWAHSVFTKAHASAGIVGFYLLLH